MSKGIVLRNMLLIISILHLFLVFFSFHFFNTHFRIEKFPMDTVIFSGRISKTEMLHERKRWYDRLVADGRLETYRIKADDWEGRKNIAKTMGFIFFVLVGSMVVSLYKKRKV